MAVEEEEGSDNEDDETKCSHCREEGQPTKNDNNVMKVKDCCSDLDSFTLILIVTFAGHAHTRAASMQL